jgi:6-phosphogluconate dehydrogenase
MHLGMIGRMGGNMVSRLMRHEHECIVYDLHRRAVDELVQKGLLGAMSLVARTGDEGRHG